MTVLSAARAKAQREGKSRFNTGGPCIYGHMSDRWTATKRCLQCQKERRALLEKTPHQRKLKRGADSKYRATDNGRKKRIDIAKRHRAKLKLQVITHYSKGIVRCTCCPESHLVFLTIDHIKGGGRKHYREMQETGDTLYKWLIKNKSPVGFQVLCFNCNFAKHAMGVCPHQQEIKCVRIV